MKILELLESVFVEAATADLYHGTSLYSATQVLQSNVLKAITPIHSTQVPSSVKGHDKTVSLTRDINVAKRFANDRQYIRADATGVIFVMDQEKLKQDLGRRVRPYDDTSSDLYRQRAQITGNKSLRPTHRTETEEVIYGDIPNVNKYIKQIIVLPPSGDHTDYNMTRIQQSGILDDPRTIFKSDPTEYQNWKKDRAPKHYLNRLTTTE